MSTLVTIAWWLLAGPLVAAELALSVPAGLVSGGLSYLDDGLPVREPFYLAQGPRYQTVKLDYPALPWSMIWYVGDEPENPPPYCKPVVEVDENSWTLKWPRTQDTENLRGDETRGLIQPGNRW